MNMSEIFLYIISILQFGQIANLMQVLWSLCPFIYRLKSLKTRKRINGIIKAEILKSKMSQI